VYRGIKCEKKIHKNQSLHLLFRSNTRAIDLSVDDDNVDERFLERKSFARNESSGEKIIHAEVCLIGS
jgi:hypothetical protein